MEPRKLLFWGARLERRQNFARAAPALSTTSNGFERHPMSVKGTRLTIGKASLAVGAGLLGLSLMSVMTADDGPPDAVLAEMQSTTKELAEKVGGAVAGAGAAVLDSARSSLGGVLELAPKKTRTGKHKKKIKSKSAVKKARKREAKAAASAAAVAAAAATPPKRKTPPAREGEAPPAAAAVGNEGEEHVESVRGLLDGAAPKVVAEMLLVNACFENHRQSLVVVFIKLVKHNSHVQDY